MIYQLYSILDQLAEEFSPLFPAKNDAVAVRQYQNLMQAQKVSPQDYSLYRLGVFDTEENLTLQRLSGCVPEKVLVNKALEEELNG